MPHIQTILRNFNTMLKDRGIEVEYYDKLLNLSEVDMRLYLESNTDATGSELEMLRTLSDDYPSVLTTTVTTPVGKVVLYWSMTPGKTLSVTEVNLVTKAVVKTGSVYAFVVCLYDKLPIWSGLMNINRDRTIIEAFSFTDFIISYRDVLLSPKKLQAMEYTKFIEENPDMEGLDLPKCNYNDPMARYVGARAGTVIGMTREIMLPMSFMVYDVNYRVVVGEIDKNADSRTGLYFDAY